VTALTRARTVKGQPTCILALTRKGFGILKLLAKLGDENFHGKPLPAKNLDEALAELAAG
jgi:transketolase